MSSTSTAWAPPSSADARDRDPATVLGPSLGSLLRGGSVATVVATSATSTVVVAGQALGVSTAVSDAVIPASGFAVLTAIFSTMGVGIAALLRRFARYPRTAWIRITVALTVLSFLPDLFAEATVTTRAFLMLTHLVAAVIVVPLVARRLA